jgi:GPH family glycoside/pentoside/hexuronide:cation symporter
MMGAIVLISGLVPVFACKERPVAAKRARVPIIRAMKEAFRMGAFRTYLLMRFCSSFGQVVFNQIIFYINAYYVCGGDKSLATKIIGVGTLLTVGLSLAALPLVPRLSRLLGKRMAVIVGCAIALLQACLVPLLYNPAQPYLQLVAAAVTAPLVAISIVMRDAIVPDICDLDELENGTRREGLFTAVVLFVYKLEVSLCVVLAGYLLKFSAFDPTLGTQPAAVLTRLQWCAFLPNIVFAGIALIFAIRFPLTEAYMHTVRAKIDARNQTTAAGADEPIPARG